VAGVQVVLHDVIVRLDDEATPSETTVSTAGPWAITLITVVPEFGLRFISSYVGGETIPTSAVHALTYRAGGRLEQREHVRDELPVTHARDRCLLDHALELQAALVEHTGARVAVDVPATALALATEKT
jgi:hypothetical protein